MATIRRYQTASGITLYRVRYRTPERGETQKRGFKTKRDAEQWANSIEVDKLTGQFIKPSLGRITVAELVTDWLERKKQATAPSHYRMLEGAEDHAARPPPYMRIARSVGRGERACAATDARG